MVRHWSLLSKDIGSNPMDCERGASVMVALGTFLSHNTGSNPVPLVFFAHFHGGLFFLRSGGTSTLRAL